MVRRSIPARISDDRYFPVPVRVGVAQGGFGEQLDVMHGWLNMRAGPGNFAIHGAPNDLREALGADAVHFYFIDIAVVRAFGEGFVCGLAVMSSDWRRDA
jgi:hypothetical protein